MKPSYKVGFVTPLSTSPVSLSCTMRRDPLPIEEEEEEEEDYYYLIANCFHIHDNASSFVESSS
jgi:hypothetical protein